MLGKLFVLYYYRTCYNIIMSAKVLCSAVNNHVGSKCKRLLEIRCKKRIVNNSYCANLMGNI